MTSILTSVKCCISIVVSVGLLGPLPVRHLVGHRPVCCLPVCLVFLVFALALPPCARLLAAGLKQRVINLRVSCIAVPYPVRLLLALLPCRCPSLRALRRSEDDELALVVGEVDLAFSRQVARRAL